MDLLPNKLMKVALSRQVKLCEQHKKRQVWQSVAGPCYALDERPKGWAFTPFIWLLLIAFANLLFTITAPTGASLNIGQQSVTAALIPKL